VPPEWERLLRQHDPITGILSHLEFRWVFTAGFKRGQMTDRSRWTLEQVQPKHAIPPGIRAMLEDRPPWSLPNGQKPGRYAFVDDYQWRYYRQHGGYTRPFWILQGPPGGHPAAYSDVEAAQFKAMGEPTVPPPVGAMRYRPFDLRVLRRIQSHDLLLQAGGMVERLFERSAIEKGLRDEADAADYEFRKHFLDWFDGAIQPSGDFLTWFSKRSEADRVLRPASKTEVAAALDLRDHFLATGYAPASHPAF